MNNDEKPSPPFYTSPYVAIGALVVIVAALLFIRSLTGR